MTVSGALRHAVADDAAAVCEIARHALTLDAGEAPQIVARLWTPPEGRRWTALVTEALDGVVFASSSATEGVGHIDLLAVHPSAQGRGIGAALVRAAEGWLRDQGAREARLAGNPPCYAWPGIDVRYTPAVCLAESLGYEKYRSAWNMTADLSKYLPGGQDAIGDDLPCGVGAAPTVGTGFDVANGTSRGADMGADVTISGTGPAAEPAPGSDPTGPDAPASAASTTGSDVDDESACPEDLARLASAGVVFHSAPPDERAAVIGFVREHWNEAWAWEVAQATGCHYATRGQEILGFAAWGARPRWFGPMGTASAARGLGVGKVLLRRCLEEQAAAGQRSTQISWVGPVGFYAKAVGARVERVFWLYRRPLV
ncbi:GNAT family N-acetyltransferase [Sphaerisporangium corydalis]|uniref:GNAT family N-acetyltransferase n=1 Tax=Sphaerisporangium corydalis TaxID=1441875 RepID=A0ABV9EBQ7_9ACTN|nr:GNAT family N-acetyltransferase [Sphaerisporangium corydalis]